MYEIEIQRKSKNIESGQTIYGKDNTDLRPIKTPRKRSFLKTTLSLLVVITVSTVLSTVMMHATGDTPFSETLLGFAFGGKESGEMSRCPEGMSFISSGKGPFCIDTYTASAGKSCPNRDPSSRSETAENILTSGCVPVSEEGVLPWRYISQTQAQEACQKAGKFLPSGEQWFYASRGTPSEQPWGSESCNLSNNWLYNPGPAGSGGSCISYAGTYDQVGNVWEWVNDTARQGVIDGQKLPNPGYITSVDATGLVLETDPENPDPNYTKDRFWVNPEGTRGVMRGGFHGSGTDGGVYSMHVEMTPDFAGRAVGFRCATEPLR